jgi:UDP-N-acetylglucosamine 2-epimerase (non-hydrolysing)
MKIICVAGGRPNFIKVKPLMEELKERGADCVLVHTGQHYDFKMSEVFFRELNIPKPDYNLGVGSGTNVWQTAEIMKRLEPIFLEEKPDVVVVLGDINSTLASALTAAKLHLPIAHVEAGLRSFNMKMQEEINRILTDRVSDFLFVTEESGRKNLIREGKAVDKIYMVGNVMIDTLVGFESKIPDSEILGDYAVLTLHRAENVDDKETFKKITDILKEINIKIVWPLHHRAKKRAEEFGIDVSVFKTTESLSYIEFISLVRGAKFVLTDSGGVQEETSFLGIPCLTLRKETERPMTVEKGTNIIVGSDKEKISKSVDDILKGNFKRGGRVPLWDGKASRRIAEILLKKP